MILSLYGTNFLACIPIHVYTVNSEFFARIALKDIFTKVKICDFDMIYLHQ